tara:strand:- start:13951 stop:15012 length:1062 start_codon:yes stop_codon:yes gene_type:complete
MADISHITQPTVAAIDAAWEAEGNRQKGHRPHLGGSIIGNECNRALWYGFRWCTDKSFDGRLLRLFNRGHEEENRFIRDLRKAGATVHDCDDRTGEQFLFKAVGGHVGGSMDGVGKGLPESPDKWHVLEFKTHSDKSFKALAKDGVEKSKPLHFAQMQLYMHWSGIDRAFYLAVNKNTDELYSERVRYQQREAERLEDKARRIVEASTPPPRMSEDPSFYLCKFCDHYDLCHQAAAPAVNCRTCAHSTPVMTGNGQWNCAFNDSVIETNRQRKGCEHHLFIPELMWHAGAEAVDASAQENWIEYRLPNGRTFRNGPKAPSSYPSIELINLPTEIAAEEGFEKLRLSFDGWAVS